MANVLIRQMCMTLSLSPLLLLNMRALKKKKNKTTTPDHKNTAHTAAAAFFCVCQKLLGTHTS